MTELPSSQIGGALAGVQRAFERPTLTLLHKQSAPLVVALFASTFRGRQAIAVEQLHLEVADLLAQLRAEGAPDVPDDAPRVLCARWVRERWLIKNVNEADEEEYQLTSHAQEALDFVARAGGARALVSGSRIRTLLDAVDHFAQDANPDRDARIASLDEQIARLEADRARLAGGGPLAPVADERMEEQHDNLLLLVRELPTDFTRVAESIKELQRTIIAQLREDDRPTGEILDEYLTASENLMENTPEGRAFLGALELLGDPGLLARLDADLAAILHHPFAERLTRAQRTSLRGIRHQIVSSIEVVLAEQARASRTLTAQIRSHNPLRDRELDQAIRDVVSALTEWFPRTGRGARVEPLTWMGRASLGRLRDSLHDLRPDVPPPGLEDWTPEDAEVDAAGLEEIRSMGGPRHAQIDAHVAALLAAGREVSVAEAFAAGSDELRRPVDLLGYLELAGSGPGGPGRDGLTDADGATSASTPVAVERVEARRSDGTTRTFTVPRLAVRRPTPGARPGAEPGVRSGTGTHDGTHDDRHDDTHEPSTHGGRS